MKVSISLESGRKKAHKHKLFALVDVQMALGQTGGCPRVNRAKKFMCSPRNTGNINLSLWLTGGLSQGRPDFQRVYVFKVYVPLSCPREHFKNQDLEFCSISGRLGCSFPYRYWWKSRTLRQAIRFATLRRQPNRTAGALCASKCQFTSLHFVKEGWHFCDFNRLKSAKHQSKSATH